MGNEGVNCSLIEELKLAAKSESLKTWGFSGWVPDSLHAERIITSLTDSLHVARYSQTTSWHERLSPVFSRMAGQYFFHTHCTGPKTPTLSGCRQCEVWGGIQNSCISSHNTISHISGVSCKWWPSKIRKICFLEWFLTLACGTKLCSNHWLQMKLFIHPLLDKAILSAVSACLVSFSRLLTECHLPQNTHHGGQFSQRTQMLASRTSHLLVTDAQPLVCISG